MAGSKFSLTEADAGFAAERAATQQYNHRMCVHLSNWVVYLSRLCSWALCFFCLLAVAIHEDT